MAAIREFCSEFAAAVGAQVVLSVDFAAFGCGLAGRRPTTVEDTWHRGAWSCCSSSRLGNQSEWQMISHANGQCIIMVVFRMVIWQYLTIESWWLCVNWPWLMMTVEISWGLGVWSLPPMSQNLPNFRSKIRVTTCAPRRWTSLKTVRKFSGVEIVPLILSVKVVAVSSGHLSWIWLMIESKNQPANFAASTMFKLSEVSESFSLNFLNFLKLF